MSIPRIYSVFAASLHVVIDDIKKGGHSTVDVARAFRDIADVLDPQPDVTIPATSTPTSAPSVWVAPSTPTGDQQAIDPSSSSIDPNPS